MSTVCKIEGVCLPDCHRRGDDCDGNINLMTAEELALMEDDVHMERELERYFECKHKQYNKT